MSESGDYEPVSWSSNDNFVDARAAYDMHAGRSYDVAVSSGKTMSDLLPESLVTDSPSPLSVDSDETGSMGQWPATIFSKLPYLYNEASKEYLGDQVAISFGAFGDIFAGETYPIQARQFARGEDLAERLKELVIEGGGGGTMHESSELLALYRARKVTMPNAINKPIHVIITDEMPYDQVTKADAARVHVDLGEKNLITVKQIFEELNSKYSAYLILKPYNLNGSDSDSSNKAVHTSWQKHFDDDHIAFLPEAGRVMDVLLGILAKETGRVDYFKKEIEERQQPDQVATVYKALKTIHALPAHATKAAKATKTPKVIGGKSTMFKSLGDGKKGNELL